MEKIVSIMLRNIIRNLTSKLFKFNNMQRTAMITERDFKDLISGRRKKDEIWDSAFIRHTKAPDIFILVEKNKIVVSGDFELTSDICFNSAEEYPYEIILDGGTYRNIIFKGGKFKQLVFRRGVYNGFVSIRGGYFQSLILLGGIFNHWLGTLNGIGNIDSLDNKLADDELKINRFEIEGGTYNNNIWLSGGNIDSLEIKCVTPVKIHCKSSDDSTYDDNSEKYVKRYKSSPEIRNLVISRYSNKDNFYHFSDLKLDNITFDSFTNIGSITIANITVSKKIIIENSDLGKTTFINCNFKNQILNFDSSKITEIALAGTTLPGPSNIQSSRNDPTQRRLALSQIKKVYQNMGDIVSASEYQAEELNTYLKLLRPGFERVNLWLNKISNKHGQSWSTALLWIILINIVMFTFYNYALGFGFELTNPGVHLFLRNISYFIEFINPLRKIDLLPKAMAGINHESEISSFVFIVDGLSRLINAYLIYQFIAAFRKYGKN